MHNSIDALTQAANAELLREKGALVLAANAGLVNEVAGRLRQHMEVKASPRLVFDVGAAALHGAERNTSQVESRHVETIGGVIADSVLIKTSTPGIHEPVSDDHIAVLLESRLSEKTRDPLISLLIEKGAISRKLKQEPQIEIPDAAYDAFLTELSGDDVDEVTDDLTILESARSLEELKRMCKDHPLMGTRELAEKFNSISEERILHSRVKFGDSIKYFNARIDLGGESDSLDAALRLTLDNKMLARAQNIAYSNNYDLLSRFLAEYDLKTSPENEQYDTLRRHYDHIVNVCHRGLMKTWIDKLANLSPDAFLENTQKKTRRGLS